MDGRLFTLDAQFLFDTIVMALSMLVMFTLLSYFLFNPVRDILAKRQQRIVDDQKAAKKEKQEAALAPPNDKSDVAKIEVRNK